MSPDASARIAIPSIPTESASLNEAHTKQRHTYQLTTDEPIVGFEVKTTYKAVRDHIRAVRHSKALAKLPASCGTVLLFMLDCVNLKALRKTGKLVAWPSYAYLAEQIGKHPNHVRRTIDHMIGAGLLKKQRQGNGRVSTRYELAVPEENFTKIGQARVTPECHPGARQRAPLARAGARQGNTRRALGLQQGVTEKVVVTTTTTTGPAAEELKKLKIFSQLKIKRLASLEQTTPTVIRAAMLQMRKKGKPPEKNVGLVEWFISNPEEIDEAVMSEAIALVEGGGRDNSVKADPAKLAFDDQERLIDEAMASITPEQLDGIVLSLLAGAEGLVKVRMRERFAKDDPRKSASVRAAVYEIFVKGAAR